MGWPAEIFASTSTFKYILYLNDYLKEKPSLILPKHIIIQDGKDSGMYIGPTHTRPSDYILKKYQLTLEETEVSYMLSKSSSQHVNDSEDSLQNIDVSDIIEEVRSNISSSKQNFYARENETGYSSDEKILVSENDVSLCNHSENETNVLMRES